MLLSNPSWLRLQFFGRQKPGVKKPDFAHGIENTVTREGRVPGTTHCEAVGGRVPGTRSSTGIGHVACASPAERDFFGPNDMEFSSQTSLSSHARGQGSLSGKNLRRPSIIALPAIHTGASGARGQIIVGAALPLRRRGAVGNAPRCGTRACAVAIQSRVSCMAFVWQVLAVLMRATRVDDCGTAH